MNRDDGFTLVEVLVAFAILALTLTLAFRSIGDSARGVQVSQQQASAVSLAQAKLSALGIDVPLEEGVTQGRHGSGMEWHLTIKPVYEYVEFHSVSGLDVFRVSIRVWWPDTGRTDRAAELSTLKFARRG